MFTDLTENLLKLVVAVMQTVPSWAERFLSGTAPYMALTRFLSVERRPQPIRERSVSPAGSEATETSENDQADPTESTDTSLTHLALGCMYNVVEEDRAAGTSLSSICQPPRFLLSMVIADPITDPGGYRYRSALPRQLQVLDAMPLSAAHLGAGADSATSCLPTGTQGRRREHLSIDQRRNSC